MRGVSIAKAFQGLSLVILLVANLRCVNRGDHPPPRGIVINCNVTRSECTGEELTSNGIECTRFETDPTINTFTASICSGIIDTQDQAKSECEQIFCIKGLANPMATYDYPTCVVNSATFADQINLPYVGTCVPTGVGGQKTRVDYQRRSRPCNLMEGGICDPLALSIVPSPTPPSDCFDLSIKEAISLVGPPAPDRDRSVQVLRIAADPNCAPTNKFNSFFDFKPGLIGQGTAGVTTAQITAASGFAALSRGCPSCQFNRIENMRINIANTTIAGTPLTNVVVQTTTGAAMQPMDASGRNVIAPGQLKLSVVGSVNGVPSLYTVENQDQWFVSASGPALRIQGDLDILDSGSNGLPLEVKVSIDAPGTPASTQTTACDGATPRDRLFGFEDVQSWSSTNASLSLVTSPLTQGCGALGVAGVNFLQINGATFSTAGLTVQPGLSVDLFIPNNQPNPFFIGNLQVLLSCPSGGVNNQFIGQIALTGKPLNQYSTLRFPLPSQTISTLRTPLNDCSFNFGLNVNQTNRTWILDNLRFTP